MARLLSLACLPVLALAALAVPAAAADFSALDSILTNTSWGLFGAALVVQQDTTVVYQRAVFPMTVTRRIPIASSSKWLSASAFMTLVDSGRVSLDDPVSRYLPLFTGPKGTMTIRQLWSHTSGMPADSPYATDSTLTLAQAVDSIALRTPLLAPPGTQFVYGQVSMQIAGRIAEVVSGRLWDDFFQDRIAGPLGMASTDFGTTSNPLVAGGGWSTAGDYARFVRMIAQGGTLGGHAVLSPWALAQMQMDQTNGVPLVSSPYAGSPWPNTRYGLGEWLTVEDPLTARGLVVSSEGKFGFSPWVEVCTRGSGALAVVGDLTTDALAWAAMLDAIRVQFPDSCIDARLDAPAAGPADGVRLSLAGANPARGAVELAYALPRAAAVRLDVFDPRGARVAVLAQGPVSAGEHRVRWTPSAALAPGVYLARLEVDGTERTTRIVHLR